METQVLEKSDEKNLFQILMKEIEEDDKEEYPEFDDSAPM